MEALHLKGQGLVSEGYSWQTADEAFIIRLGIRSEAVEIKL